MRAGVRGQARDPGVWSVLWAVGLGGMAMALGGFGQCGGGGEEEGVEVLDVAPGYVSTACAAVEGGAVLALTPGGEGGVPDGPGKVCQFDDSGEVAWCADFPGTPLALVRGAEGRVFAGGQCENGACVAAYDADGAVVWMWPQGGGAGPEGAVLGLAVEWEGSPARLVGVVAVGYMVGYTVEGDSSSKDAWMARLGSDGGATWQQRWGDERLDETLQSVAIDPEGRMYVGGMRYVDMHELLPEVPPSVGSRSGGYVAALDSPGSGDPAELAWEDGLDPECTGHGLNDFVCDGPYEVASVALRAGVIYAGGSTDAAEFFVQTYDVSGTKGWHERYQFQDTTMPLSYLVAVLPLGQGAGEDLLLVGWGHGPAGDETLLARVGPGGELMRFGAVSGPGDDDELDAKAADVVGGSVLVVGRSWHRSAQEESAFLFWLGGGDWVP